MPHRRWCDRRRLRPGPALVRPGKAVSLLFDADPDQQCHGDEDEPPSRPPERRAKGGRDKQEAEDDPDSCGFLRCVAPHGRKASPNIPICHKICHMTQEQDVEQLVPKARGANSSRTVSRHAGAAIEAATTRPLPLRRRPGQPHVPRPMDRSSRSRSGRWRPDQPPVGS